MSISRAEPILYGDLHWMEDPLSTAAATDNDLEVELPTLALATSRNKSKPASFI